MAVGVHGLPGVLVQRPVNLMKNLLDKGQEQGNAIIHFLLEVVVTALVTTMKLQSVTRNLVMV